MKPRFPELVNKGIRNIRRRLKKGIVRISNQRYLVVINQMSVYKVQVKHGKPEKDVD